MHTPSLARRSASRLGWPAISIAERQTGALREKVKAALIGLNPAVRDALAAIVSTLNGPGSAAAAAPVAAGLFVPLAELERRGVQPALAGRALADVGLLVHAGRDGPATVTADFRGEPTIGLVVAPACIDGFDPAAFEPAAHEEP